jgi:hypothetical protein
MANLGPNFYPKLVQVASEVGMRPEDILAIMVSESGINPSIQNRAGHAAVGLIQFTPGTLKGVGYKGDWRSFVNVPADKQLDYVKRYIEDKIKLAGRPLKSAAEFYVGTFWPIALKLPGIKKNDSRTIIVEERPQVIRDPKTGRLWSKKYYDMGIRIDPKQEAAAYKANPLFHGNVSGAITFGDMIAQVEKNKRSPLYARALENMKRTTGYVAESPRATTTVRPKRQFGDSGFIARLERLLKMFVTASEKNTYLITVGSSSDYVSTVEYAHILSAALEEYFDAKTSIHADDTNVEVECKVSGDKKYLFDAIKEITVGVSDAFKYATKDIGSITGFALVTADLKSDYTLLDPKRADMLYRKFKLKFASKK